ncbi:HAD hydrolase-like protein [Amycolatopsis sp. NPDC051071]|uniref:HAD hydrolase-like protein n=1 Tax=Amycolatopsis sp. NPDC051071 TaxID=3154637 RepID=UPI00341545A3
MLWDIDQTLVDLRGLGAIWYTAALADVAGVELRQLPSFGGRTERAISTDILTSHGVEATEENVRALWLALIAVSESHASTLASNGRALPGAKDALNDFATHGGVVQTLVTGNLPEISVHKLTAFDLHEHVDFEIGGYGSLSAHRPDLVPAAVGRAAEKHGTEFPPASVVIIGDTPDDVRAALDNGAVAVAVATGQYSAEELADAGAHTVLGDLSDLAAVRAAVLGATP